MEATWTPERLFECIRGFQPACVIAAAADLDVLSILSREPMNAATLAGRVDTDERGLRILLDALAGMALLDKTHDTYAVTDSLKPYLSEDSRDSVLPGILHLANCLRRWSQLALVIKKGHAPQKGASIRGSDADTRSFIGAMQGFSQPLLPMIIERLQPLTFTHLLDIGGASGQWTAAFLKAVPNSRATLFDLPEVVGLARAYLGTTELSDRVRLIGGDYNVDRLPPGADLAWLSAITHQNSREQNRALYTKICAALNSGGHLIIRDIIMEPDHTRPVGGALFAVNMLVGTEQGGTFTWEEYAADLHAAGFEHVDLIYRDEGMNSLIRASKL